MVCELYPITMSVKIAQGPLGIRGFYRSPLLLHGSVGIGGSVCQIWYLSCKLDFRCVGGSLGMSHLLWWWVGGVAGDRR